MTSQDFSTRKSEVDQSSDEAKFCQIQEDLKTTYAFYKDQGLSDAEIRQKAKPLLEYIGQSRRRKWLRWWLICSMLIGLVAAVMQMESVWNFTLAVMRITSIQVLPIWDWTKLYSMECLIPNPFFLIPEPEEEDCQVCKGLMSIGRVANLSHTELTEHYIPQELPVVVTDATQGWHAQEKFNPKFLFDLYTKEEILRSSAPCLFASSSPNPDIHMRQFLKDVIDGHLKEYYAYWENCDRRAAKVIRSFYKRLYFLPPTIEVDSANWIFISSKYLAQTNKPIDIPLPMVWYSQLKGKSKMVLTPRGPCNPTCATLYVTLHPGETLFFPDFLWMLDFKPLGDAMSVAIAGGGSID